MRGRFPRCRFANVVLWNHRLQTPPYRHRRVSLNRNQIALRAGRPLHDGRRPSRPGRRRTGSTPPGCVTGMIFWRFLLPEENAPPIEAEVVELASLS